MYFLQKIALLSRYLCKIISMIKKKRKLSDGHATCSVTSKLTTRADDAKKLSISFSFTAPSSSSDLNFATNHASRSRRSVRYIRVQIDNSCDALRGSMHLKWQTVNRVYIRATFVPACCFCWTACIVPPKELPNMSFRTVLLVTVCVHD